MIRLVELVAKRPAAGPPRPYEFPASSQVRLDSGFRLITINVPGRPLGGAYLLLEAGAAYESPARGGVASLAAKALIEGTERYDAFEFTEAAERLGADLKGEADWDTLRVILRVPVTRLEPALELLAEAARRPIFPGREVERLKQERLNRIMQEYADPAQRANHAFLAATYEAQSPYSRVDEGTFDTVSNLDRDAVESYYRKFATPNSATLVVAGDIEGLPVGKITETLFGDWQAAEPKRQEPKVEERVASTEVTLVNRPGSVQSQIAIGHMGVERLIPDYFPLSLMITALGGLFDSRLNKRLREEKGYTYGANARFEFRRGPGPFRATAAVETKVTAEAIGDTIEILAGAQTEGLTKKELDDARDFLVGVFPLRFETPEAIGASMASRVTYRLPDDFFDTYRSNMETVTLEDANAAAATRLRPDRLAIVVVGDASAVQDSLGSANFGPVTVVDDKPPGPAGG